MMKELHEIQSEIGLPPSVPYIVHESMMARYERIVKRLIISLIIAVVLIGASNLMWLHEWTQYDYADEETESVNVQSDDGTANYIGNDGDITNGEH